MERTAVNPTEWGLGFFMNQGEITEGATRHLRCSGQVALVPDPEAEMGLSPAPVGDIRGQIEAALASVDELLAGADMDRSNIVFINFFTTDIDEFLANYDVYASWIEPAGVMPPQSLIGVARLVMPDLLVEIEVQAAT
ncbi:MAG: RidA family protein [Acidimicrobiia bacterium]|nr:RidA family protein [Acidimicrobiia bacterium]